MEVKYIKDENNDAEIELDNLTIAELMRVYLAEDKEVVFVAWRREHPNKNPTLKIKTKGKTVKKAIGNAIFVIEKEIEDLGKEFKKSK